MRSVVLLVLAIFAGATAVAYAQAPVDADYFNQHTSALAPGQIEVLTRSTLPDAVTGGDVTVSVIVLSVLMICAMTASQFITQKQIMSKNMSEDAMASPFMRQQKMMLYVLPLVFGIGGINFPIGVLIYWTTTNLWTMGQQFFVIRRMPTPGSPAYREYQQRRAAKGLPLLTAGRKSEPVPEVVVEPKGQRQQPQRKNRKKK